jgi:trans-aconitate methyltransferase
MDIQDVLNFYQELEDPAYVEGSVGRSIQARKILNVLSKYISKGHLLDIGAGSGILVEQALLMGYQAVGIEPSKWLCGKAREKGIPVQLGAFPSEKLRERYDIITCIDVIEHVSNPFEFLSQIRSRMEANGVLAVVTPDVMSAFAKLFGWRWWHFRLAHIGYFSKKNFTHLAERAGFDVVSISSPSWYFNLDYICKRAENYLPKFICRSLTNFFKKAVIPIKLYDSILCICKPKRKI